MSPAKKNKTPKNLIRYQLRITLLGISPPVWRLVEVPGSLTLGALHNTIQLVMGWGDEHLHEFMSSRGRNATIYAEDDERSVRVWQVLKRKGSKFYYRYDFGDCWDHEIRVENRLNVTTSDEAIRCLDGRRACPPEDSGGAWSYMEAIKRLASDENDAELREWYGDFDPEQFALRDVQAILSQA